MSDRVLFSAVEGRVVIQGRPVAGAVVERTLEWSGQAISDRATSDAEGRFRFAPVVRKSSFMDRVLPSEPVIKQRIVIGHAGKIHTAWQHFKRNFDDNGELAGQPIRMLCPLEQEPSRRGAVFGVCQLTPSASL